MSTATQGTIRSGDVTLFYRHFGTASAAAPVIIIHGANYYDSFDWIEVAGALARDREVVAYDQRGFGESSWSAARDYSNDAVLGDITALLDHFGWKRAVVMGHSMGGGQAVLYGARMPERTAAVVLVDHCPGAGGAAAAPGQAGPAGFPSLEAALKATSRDQRTPLSRVEGFTRKTDGGLLFKRDPSFSNKKPDTAGWSPKIVSSDAWADLAAIAAPLLVIRGTQSDRFDDTRIARVQQVQPNVEIANIDCGHDVAGAAPDALIAAVGGFLRQRAIQSAA